MWNKKEEPPAPALKETLPPPPVREPVREVRAPEPPRDSSLRGGIATVGKSLIIKGNVGGSEDLYIDGEVEGSVELKDNNITIGPNGRVNASLHARDIVVLGRVKGNVKAIERLELRKTGSLVGDIITARVVIEDGAYFKGSIDIQKAGAAAASSAAPAAQVQAATASAPASSTSASSAPAPSSPSTSTPASPSSQGGFNLSGEPKKY